MSNPILNKVKERVLFLSPTVQAGWEPESKKEDFEEIKVIGQGSWLFMMVRCIWRSETSGA